MSKPTLSIASARAMSAAARELHTAYGAALRAAEGLGIAGRSLPEGSEERAKVEALAAFMREIRDRLNGQNPPGEINAFGTALEIGRGDFVQTTNDFVGYCHECGIEVFQREWLDQRGCRDNHKAMPVARRELVGQDVFKRP